MLFVGSLMAKKISVGTCVKQQLIAFSAALSHRKGNCTVRKLSFDLLYNGAEPFIGKIRVLSALKYKGTQAKPMSLFATAENVVLRHTIADAVFIFSPYAAVKAVVFADVADFNKPSYKNFVGVNTASYSSSTGSKVFRSLR